MDARELDVENYLSDNEKNFLNQLDTKSNFLNDEIKKSRDFLNISIKQLFINWSQIMNQIINELTTFISNSRKFSKYFNDIDNTNRWFIGVKNFFSELIYIFVKDNRSIYFGVSLVILSLLIYFIQISS